MSLYDPCWQNGFLRQRKYWTNSAGNVLPNTSMMANAFKLTNKTTKLDCIPDDWRIFLVNIPMQLTCSRLILRRKKPYWNANALLWMWILANCDHFRSSCTEDANMRLGKRLRIILSRCLCLKCFMLTGKI